MRRLLALGILATGMAAKAGGFDYDSRRVYDLCSPDQIAESTGVRIKWGHYYQWRTNSGSVFGPGSFVTTAWNTCLGEVDYTYVSWRGEGDATFWLRGADDGDPLVLRSELLRRIAKGRNRPGMWSEWVRLTRGAAGGGRRLDVPGSLDGRQWIQLKCELGAGASLTRFEIHKRMVLPDHPRIILTPKKVAEVKRRTQESPEIRKIYEHYIKNLKSRARQGWVRTNRNTWTAAKHMVSLGIAWNLSQDPAFLEEARKQLERSDSDWAKNLGHFPRPQWLGGTAVCLDLVWNGLTDGERERFTKALLSIADKQQKSWRFSDVSNQIYVNSGKNVLTGLAVAGAGVDTKKEMFYLRQAEDLIRNHLIPATNFWAADDGGWGEGHGYCSFTQADWAVLAHAWASASGEDIFQKANFFKFLAQWRVYERRYDGSQAKFNDSARGSVSVPFPAFTAGRFRDRVAQRQARAEIDRALANPGDFSVTNLWQAVLWYDPGLPAAGDYSYPETMPLGRHFAGVGHVVCRSGWGPEDLWAVFKSGPAFTPGTHYHADENSFVIDRGGSLAIDSGSDDRSCPHYRSYFCRTIAHNTITVKKPGEKFRGKGDIPNDGGQMGGSWTQVGGREYDSSQWGMHIRPPLQLDGIVAFETNGSYTYAVGDAAKAYSRDKVTAFTRQFLHLRPNVILIFDRVTSTDPSYEKRWLMHTVNEPDIRGRTAVVTHLKGRLFSETLLPKDARVSKLGGPGREFRVDGRNYPIKDKKKTWEPGAWRIEVFPGAAVTPGPSRSARTGAARRTDCFLHYIYVTDPGTDSAPRAKMSEGEDRVTLSVDDAGRTYVVSFARTGPVGGRVRVSVKLNGGGGTLVDKDLATEVQPQRFDTEDIWE